jgi:hypothetical protein
MHFKNFLFEDDKIKQYSILLKECEIMNSDAMLLFRGSKHQNSNFERIKTRKDRRPLDTSPLMQKYMDDAFENKFKERIRSTTVFCAQDKVMAGIYGPLYVVFPTTKAEYFSTDEFIDLNSVFSDYIGRTLSKLHSKKVSEFEKKYNYDDYAQFLPDELLRENSSDDTKSLDMLNDFLDCIADFYEKTNVPKNRIGEQMILCDEYILVKYSSLPEPDVNTYSELKKVLEKLIENA